MPPLPAPMVPLVEAFRPAFSRPTFGRAVVVLCGMVLASGSRTVAAALRAVGLAHDPHFGNAHRLLSRARWSPLALSAILLPLVVTRLLVPGAPVVLLLDETLERRRGRHILYKGRFRDPVRSKGPYLVRSEGVQWLSLMVLVPLPWCRRPWALPVATIPILSPSTSARLGRRHRTAIDGAMTLVRLARRWLPLHEILVVADGGFAAVGLGHACVHAGCTFVTRSRLDAALYDPPAPKPAGKRGRAPTKGARHTTLKARLTDPTTAWERREVAWYGGETTSVDLATGTALWYRAGQPPLPLRWVLVRDPAGTRAPMALSCTDPQVDPWQVLASYIARWNIEVTFEELRADLGFETQRGWSLLTIQRSTPCLFGLFTTVTLSAHALHADHLPPRTAAWYAKEEPTFIDALAAVRRALWTARNTQRLHHPHDEPLFPGDFFAALVEAAADAA